MADASPSLHAILTRWVDRRGDRDHEAAARHENLLLIERHLDESLATHRQKRRGDLVELESLTEAAGTRWIERLKRLENWTEMLVASRNELGSAADVLHDTRWFDRWQETSPRWIARFQQRADRWDERRQLLGADLQRWVENLDAQLVELNKFVADSKDTSTDFLVSRARKQPYLDFVLEQEQVESALGHRLQALRRVATQQLGRYLAGQRVLEEAGARQSGLWEIHRPALVEIWSPVEERWRRLREEVLKNALVFEGGRRRLRTLKDAVRSMRCVEDVYKAPTPAWKQILGSISIK